MYTGSMSVAISLPVRALAPSSFVGLRRPVRMLCSCVTVLCSARGAHAETASNIRRV